MRQQRIWLSGWRNGLTLIEVVVGIALAGTLLVSVILATTAQRRQLRKAKDKQIAVEALDRFLSKWAVDRFSDRSREKAAQAANVQLDGGLNETVGGRVEVRIVHQRLGGVASLPLRIARVEAFVGGREVADSWVEIVREEE